MSRSQPAWHPPQRGSAAVAHRQQPGESTISSPHLVEGSVSKRLSRRRKAITEGRERVCQVAARNANSCAAQNGILSLALQTGVDQNVPELGQAVAFPHFQSFERFFDESHLPP